MAGKSQSENPTMKGPSPSEEKMSANTTHSEIESHMVPSELESSSSQSSSTNSVSRSVLNPGETSNNMTMEIVSNESADSTDVSSAKQPSVSTETTNPVKVNLSFISSFFSFFWSYPNNLMNT